MSKLFSPVVIGHRRVANRLALPALPSGCAAIDGFFGAELANYYLRRAQSGLGLMVVEPACVLPPPDPATPHVGLYADAQVTDIRAAMQALLTTPTTVLMMLDQPLWTLELSEAELRDIGEAFIAAAWRARAAGAHGVMLSTADGGPFEQLLSPLRNTRSDAYGRTLVGRLKLLDNVVEGIVRWLGHDFVVGVRLNVEEFTPGGLRLRDARTIAPRLVSSGVALLEISAATATTTPIARFPGWRVPLASGVKSVVDVPVMVGGLLDDAEFAESVLREGSADIISIGMRLRSEPDWPLQMQTVLAQR